MTNGIIFINEEGKYACISQPIGFRNTETIFWVDSLNSASLVPNESIARNKFAALRESVALNATETRIVKIVGPE